MCSAPIPISPISQSHLPGHQRRSSLHKKRYKDRLQTTLGRVSQTHSSPSLCSSRLLKVPVWALAKIYKVASSHLLHVLLLYPLQPKQ
ncbi:hypothetical protein V2G26_011114 [Clonostachys chloroleuca]